MFRHRWLRNGKRNCTIAIGGRRQTGNSRSATGEERRADPPSSSNYRIMKPIVFALFLLPLASGTAFAQHPDHAPHTTAAASDTSDVLSAADALGEAIVAGDRAAVERLMLPEARIMEGGNTETRAEYLSHHFASDGSFLRAVQQEPLSRNVEFDAHTARVVSTSRLYGTYRERSLDLISTEVLLLRHSPDEGWKVLEVHWTSEPRG